MSHVNLFLAVDFARYLVGIAIILQSNRLKSISQQEGPVTISMIWPKHNYT